MRLPVPRPFSAYQRAVKQKRRVRRAEGEGAVGSKPARPVMNEATAERRTGLRCLRFFVGESVKTAKSQTFLNSPRRLGAPRQRVLRRGSRLRPKHIHRPPSCTQVSSSLAIADASRHAHGSNHSAISGSSVTSRIIVSIMSCLEFAASSIRIASAKGLA